MKVRDGFELPLRKEILPGPCDRVRDEPAYAELPVVEGNFRLVPQIQHRPGVDQVLTGRQSLVFGLLSLDLPSRGVSLVFGPHLLGLDHPVILTHSVLLRNVLSAQA